MNKSSLQEETRERLDTWERELRAAIESTDLEEERHRIQRELMELSSRREELDALDAEQLKTLHDRLARDPRAWVRHRV